MSDIRDIDEEEFLLKYVKTGEPAKISSYSKKDMFLFDGLTMDIFNDKYKVIDTFMYNGNFFGYLWCEKLDNYKMIKVDFITNGML